MARVEHSQHALIDRMTEIPESKNEVADCHLTHPNHKELCAGHHFMPSSVTTGCHPSWLTVSTGEPQEVDANGAQSPMRASRTLSSDRQSKKPQHDILEPYTLHSNHSMGDGSLYSPLVDS